MTIYRSVKHFSVWMLAATCLIALAEDDQTLNDIERAQQMHENFWGKLLKQYEVEFRTQANSREQVLTVLKIYEGRREISESTPIRIAANLAPYFRNFSYFEIEGEGLDQIESAAYKVKEGGFIYTNPQFQSDRLIHIPGGHYADWDKQVQTILIQGEGVITGLRLVSLEGIASTFDASSFVLPESTQPSIRAVLKVDPRLGLSIEGVRTLPEERFYRYYSNPNGDRSGMEPYFKEKGFLPGRQMLKLAHELETRHGTFRPPLLNEDQEREGYADLSIFEQRNFNHYKSVDPALQFAQCFNIWPSFMEVKIDGHKNVLGTPDVICFDAAAELAAAYISDEINDSGRSANYWEVKNESDITHEWTYHAVSGFDSWTLLGEFHNGLAQAIKEVDPSIMVGGPASAWPRMEMGGGGFKVWDNHRRFMQVTRDYLDFYSHHFYDVGVNSSFDARGDRYEDWLQGRLDCVLDMLVAEMRNTNNIKPLLITEYGTLTGGIREIDYWLRVNNYSSFMFQFMERPGDFELTVPFLLGFMHWEPDSGFALVRKDAQGGGYQLTKNAYFLDLWEGVGGDYLYLEPIHPKVHSLAWKKEKRIFVAVNNQSGADVNLRPELILPKGNKVISIQYRHPTYTNGQFQMQRGILTPEKSLRIRNAETAILEIQTEALIPTVRVLEQRSYYADQTAILLSYDTLLEIDVPEEALEQAQSATLRMGIRDANGPIGTIDGQFNTHPFSVSLERFSTMQNFFEYVDVEIPIQKLKEKNVLSLNLPHSSTFISHAKLIIGADEP
ncbi:MAG: Beta-porphyranase A [Opitutia bacterium UBA7350]|nr:MAG: Beta-porphyranase A [Opitutae bacterium UBA7350]